jgi:preprotein translocase subunit SecF
MSVLILFIYASVNNIQSVRDFILPMLIGVISGCYSTIFIAGPLWVMWKESRLKKKVAARPAKA